MKGQHKWDYIIWIKFCLDFIMLTFSCFRKMASYKLCVSGKFEHLIKTCQDRMCSIPTATREKIQEFYDLTVTSKEKVTNLGFSPKVTAVANQLDFEMQLKM